MNGKQIKKITTLVALFSILVTYIFPFGTVVASTTTSNYINSLSSWEGITNSFTDAKGDAQGNSVDLLALNMTNDDQYIYFKWDVQLQPNHSTLQSTAIGAALSNSTPSGLIPNKDVMAWISVRSNGDITLRLETAGAPFVTSSGSNLVTIGTVDRAKNEGNARVFGEGTNGAVVHVVARFPFSAFQSLKLTNINKDGVFPLWGERTASQIYGSNVQDRLPDGTGFFIYSAPTAGAVAVGTTFSSEKDFLTYSFVEQIRPAVFNSEEGTITITVSHDTDVTNLVANFSTSYLTKGILVNNVAQESGITSNNFTSSVTYTVIAEDGSTKNWVVSVLLDTPKSIEITPPTKTEYVEGQNLDLDGAIATLFYNDGKTKDVMITSDMISGYDPTKTEVQTITVSVDGKTATFSVNVIAKAVETIEIISLPTKTEYIQGQELDLTGAKVLVTHNDGSFEIVDVTSEFVTITLEDGSTELIVVTSASISGFDKHSVGEQTITVTIDGKTATFNVIVIARAVETIAIASAPEKIEYVEGQPLDITGTAIVLTYNDGTTELVEVTPDMVSGFDTNVFGQQQITVTYEGKTTTFTIVVIEKVAVQLELVSAPYKLEYIVGQNLNLEGAFVNVIYNDGEEKEIAVTLDMISGFNKLDTGSQVITVLTEGVTAVFHVTVIARVVNAIELTSAPEIVEYEEGQELNVKGATITLTYNDQSTEIIDVTPEMVSGFDSNVTGKQEVTITFSNFTVTFTITVVANATKFPAAPAVAAKILKENNISNIIKVRNRPVNIIQTVADHMGSGTDFNGVKKTDAQRYEEEVKKFLKERHGLNIN